MTLETARTLIDSVGARVGLSQTERVRVAMALNEIVSAALGGGQGAGVVELSVRCAVEESDLVIDVRGIPADRVHDDAPRSVARALLDGVEAWEESGGGTVRLIKHL